MKLSFTTLGCPEWPLDKVIEQAVSYGFDAIDFRGLSGELAIYRLPEFAERAKETHRKIADAGLRVSCFASSVALCQQDNHNNLQEIAAYARLCEQFDTRYIRVFGGGIGDMPREEAAALTARNANELGRIAQAHGAKILLETHDDWTACADVRRVMEQVDPEAVGVLWDVHHPYRMLGEHPADTWNTLGSWIDYTHVKDSLLVDDGKGDFHYCLTGEGDVPLPDIYRLLLQNGYQGYYTLEWEKKWIPDLEEPEIVFPHYVQHMKKLGAEIRLS